VVLLHTILLLEKDIDTNKNRLTFPRAA